jgi:hypothetical protein
MVSRSVSAKHATRQCAATSRDVYTVVIMPTTRSKKAKIDDGTSFDVDTDNRQSVGKKVSPKKAKASPKKVRNATFIW